MHRAFLVEAALFFALTSDAANDEPPLTGPSAPTQRPLPLARAQSACAAKPSRPAAGRLANSNVGEPMCACVGVSRAI
jgi:hypothetical protein